MDDLKSAEVAEACRHSKQEDIICVCIYPTLSVRVINGSALLLPEPGGALFLQHRLVVKHFICLHLILSGSRESNFRKLSRTKVSFNLQGSV